MIDTTTGRPLQLSTVADAWPYLIVPFAQLDKITALLDANEVRYWVDEETLSMDGGPETIGINLAHGSNPAMIQRLLDGMA